MKIPHELFLTLAKQCDLIDDSSVNPASPEYLADLMQFAALAAEWGYEACREDHNLNVVTDWESE